VYSEDLEELLSIKLGFADELESIRTQVSSLGASINTRLRDKQALELRLQSLDIQFGKAQSAVDRYQLLLQQRDDAIAQFAIAQGLALPDRPLSNSSIEQCVVQAQQLLQRYRDTLLAHKVRYRVGGVLRLCVWR
jgi:DNA repair exonuclease SbcCD ATPase subunit